MSKYTKLTNHECPYCGNELLRKTTRDRQIFMWCDNRWCESYLAKHGRTGSSTLMVLDYIKRRLGNPAAAKEDGGFVRRAFPPSDFPQSPFNFPSGWRHTIPKKEVGV